MSRYGTTPDPVDQSAAADPPKRAVPPTIAEERSDSEVALDTLRRYASPPPETPPAQRSRRPRQTTINGAMLIVGLIAVALIAIRGEVNNSRYTDATSAEAVAANRVKASAEVRGYPGMPCPDPLVYSADSLTLECANRAVVQVGGEAVPDPGDEATPTQMGATLARALDRLDRALERSGKGPRPGVSSPAPSGRFPGAR